MWNYLTTPFLFEWPGFETVEGEPLGPTARAGAGSTSPFRRASIPCDPQGGLRRHDYSPDVVASFANAAHLCSGHTEVGGLVFPTSRRVVPKGPGGRPLPGPTIVSIELSSIGVS